MPFTPATFGPAGGQSRRGSGPVTAPGQPQCFTYRTDDAHAAVDSAGYFNAVRTMLEVGDMIDVVVVNGAGVVQTYGRHIVMTRTATAVDVSNVTVGVVTNTD